MRILGEDTQDASARMSGIGLDANRSRTGPQARLDGGDVCEAGDHFFIGVSHRTNEEGAAQLARWLEQRGFSREELQALLAGSGVEYLGHTRDVQPYLACASVFVLPTYYREGLPRTILEAMAVGRPIITTNMPGCRETVITGFNGYLVSPRDPISLAEAMTRFLEQEALASAMGKRSRWLRRIMTRSPSGPRGPRRSA